MPNHDILFPIDSDIKIATIQSALKFSETIGCKLCPILFLTDPNDLILASIDGYVPNVNPTIIQEVAKNNQELIDNLQKLFTGFEGLKLETLEGPVTNLFEKRASFSEFILFKKGEINSSISINDSFNFVLNHKTKPFFIMNHERSLDKILIAWDCSPEAIRAVYSSLPFLNKAKQIYIYTSGEVYSEIESLSLENLKAKLNNINPIVEIIKFAKQKNIGASIIEFSVSNNIDLIIAGAYHHSKSAEFLFGGVTKYLIESEDTPSILFSH